MQTGEKISTEQRRANRERYFKEQDFTTEKYVVPYIESCKQLARNARVLEIGCGEGGNLKYFVSKGYEVVGIDLIEVQIERAKYYLDKFTDDTSKLQLLTQNIYDVNPADFGKFDLIMMRDVIEHIPDQEKFMAFLHQFVKPDGLIFFGFPPWYMPFGGHQQGCKSILGKTPFFHILPAFLYKAILKLFGESEQRMESLLQTKSTGISIERFRRIAKSSNWDILDETIYFINPNYEIKFKLKPKKQNFILANIPFVRNFVSTCAYYLIKPKA